MDKKSQWSKFKKKREKGTWQQIRETVRWPVTRVGDSSSISKPKAWRWPVTRVGDSSLEMTSNEYCSYFGEYVSYSYELWLVTDWISKFLEVCMICLECYRYQIFRFVLFQKNTDIQKLNIRKYVYIYGYLRILKDISFRFS